VKIWPFVAAAALVALLIRRRRHLEPTLLVGGALIAIVLCVYGSGAVKLPNLETLLVDIGQTLGPWTYLLVGVLAFLETGAFIGLIAPGETAMMLGGVVAGQGEINVITLIAVAWAAAVAGDCASYLLGRRLGREFLVKHGARVQIGPERLASVETFFEKHGGKAIFIGRFVGIVRAVAPFLAGSGRMPFRRFIPYDVLGAGLWATTFILIGYVFWQSFDRVLKIAKEGALGLGIAITLIAGIVWLVRWLRVAENRARLERDIDAALDRPVLRLLRPVVRWARGPLRFFIGRLTPGQLGLELTTLLAIGAVGSFAFLGYWIMIAHGEVPTMDARVNGWAVDISQPTAVDVAKVLTTFGAPWLMEPLCAVVAIVLLLRRRALEAAVIGIGMGMTVALVQIAKHATDRARPGNELVDAAGSAYPSGHAAYAMAWIALAVVGVRVVPALRGRWWLVVAAIALAALVGLTRLYLRVHWLSDVLGGEGVAAMSFSVVAIVALVVAFVRQNAVPEQR
jgi:membrane protein DedA with SNARE-associated domain/membrane-associated phospholipid phosphatase